jgi:hypothetical protein
VDPLDGEGRRSPASDLALRRQVPHQCELGYREAAGSLDRMLIAAGVESACQNRRSGLS